MTATSTTQGRVGFFLLGVAATIVAIFLGGYTYLKYGNPPVATADPSFPMEAQIVHVPLEARITREMQSPPFGPDDQVYEAGARIYVKQCASCHGTPGDDVPFAKSIFPKAPQLWKKHGNGVLGVSDDEVGETYWKVNTAFDLQACPPSKRCYRRPRCGRLRG